MFNQFAAGTSTYGSEQVENNCVVAYLPDMFQRVCIVASWLMLAFIVFATLSPLEARPVLVAAQFERFAAFAVLGLAFKPHSDDIRDSPALDVAVRLAAAGAIVTATDPEAVPNSRRRAPQLTYVATAKEAAAGADIVVLITEWPEFRELDPVALGELVAGKRIIDGRNVLDPAAWRAAGWSFRGLGR